MTPQLLEYAKNVAALSRSVLGDDLAGHNRVEHAYDPGSLVGQSQHLNWEKIFGLFREICNLQRISIRTNGLARLFIDEVKEQFA